MPRRTCLRFTFMIEQINHQLSNSQSGRHQVTPSRHSRKRCVSRIARRTRARNSDRAGRTTGLERPSKFLKDGKRMSVFSVSRIYPSFAASAALTLAVEFDCSGEALIFDTEGIPQHGQYILLSPTVPSDMSELTLIGLTGGFEGDRRVEFILPPSARKGSSVTYYIEASCNGMFGQSGIDPPDVSPQAQACGN